MYRGTVSSGVWHFWVWVVAVLCKVNAAGAEPRVAASGNTPAVAATAGPSPAVASEHWCAPELTPLTETVCYYTPQQDAAVQAHGSGTLVIFLHSLVSAQPKAAWEQQLRMRRLANTYNFTMLIPRGRPGFGPGRDPGTLAWPTAQQLQQEHEAELLAEWENALRRAQASHGAFERVFLVGFSNGAYYATSLAFRERFASDGVAVFAGGSGNKYHRLTAARATRRVPMFVGYGTLDPDNPQQRSLVALLKQLGWPHRALAAKVGHTVSSEQLRAALQFLGHPSATKE